MNPIDRHLESVIREDAAFYPAITLFGPRQAGKTTLVRHCFPNHEYVNLEDPEERALAKNDYKSFLRNHPGPMILDEVQRVPEITSALQVLIDERRHETGRFVLTGSHQTKLFEAVSQSLAGRTSVLSLFPPDLSELAGRTDGVSTDELLVRGFMPDLWARRTDPTRFYRNYYRTYVERDLRQISAVSDLAAFDRFVRLLAGRVGQVLNLSTMTSETGFSSTTLSGWLSILEASYLVFRLHPDAGNIARRMVRSPKIYFSEPGLAAYLLGISTSAQMSRDPLRGHLFENLVVSDAFKRRHHAAKDPDMGFLRTHNGFEIDLVLRNGRETRPVEIKSAATWNPKFSDALERYARDVSGCVRPTVVYDGEDRTLASGIETSNYRRWVP